MGHDDGGEEREGGDVDGRGRGRERGGGGREREREEEERDESLSQEGPLPETRQK